MHDSLSPSWEVVSREMYGLCHKEFTDWDDRKIRDSTASFWRNSGCIRYLSRYDLGNVDVIGNLIGSEPYGGKTCRFQEIPDVIKPGRPAHA